MDTVRIADLLDPFLSPPGDRRLTTVDLGQILTYINLLLRWNARTNLTAIRNRDEIVTRHFGESFFLARHLFPIPQHGHPERCAREHTGQAQVEGHCGPPAVSTAEPLPTAHQPPTTVVDIGSGTGFPALPLKIWAPAIHLTLIESNHKKSAFLREVIRALILTNVNVISERAETVVARVQSRAISPRPDPSPPLLPADAVTFRAVEKFHQILPLALNLLAPGGSLAVLVGAAQVPLLQSAAPLTWRTIPIPNSKSRTLAIGR